jgi:hypothetical protein
MAIKSMDFAMILKNFTEFLLTETMAAIKKVITLIATTWLLTMLKVLKNAIISSPVMNAR